MYKILLLILAISFSIAGNIDKQALYNSLQNSVKMNEIGKIKQQFGKFLPQQAQLKKVTKQFSNINKHNTDNYLNLLKTKIENICYKKEDNFNYLTKAEFDKMKQISLKNIKMMNDIRKHGFNFLFIFTSRSVPNKVIANWLLEVGILEKAHADLLPIVYIRGFGKHFKQYFFNLTNDMNKEIPKEYKPYIRNSFRLKLGTQFFEYFHLKRVPALALAHCTNASPMVKDCKIKYLMRGDMHLEYFFNVISEKNKNPEYKKYYRILIGNKIVNYKRSNH